MHPDLLDLLACPGCQGNLILEESDSSSDGWLTCSHCAAKYPVREGIPRFLQDSSSAETARSIAQFQEEFSALEQSDKDMDSLRLREYYFFSRTGLDPKVYEAIAGDFYRTDLPPDAYRPDGHAMAGKIVLDAGCGPGRFTEVAAHHASRLVVGLDLGEHIERASRRCSALPNVAFVQGSVLSPPFKQEAFDLVFSIGVLHHTGNPRSGAREVGGLVAPGGRLCLWMYPPEYWGKGIQRPIARMIHKYVSRKEPREALRFCKRSLYPLGRLQMRIHAVRILKYLFAFLFLIRVPRHPIKEVMLATIFDYYGPTHITTHEPAEIVEWLNRDGLLEPRILPIRTAVTARKAGLHCSE